MGDLIKSLFNGLDIYFIDTNEKKTIFNYQKKETFEHKEKEYVINPRLIRNGVLLFHSKYAEPLNWEINDSKTEYYIDSSEFKSIVDNKILKQLMYVNEKNMITLLVILIVGLFFLNLYLSYEIMNIKDLLEGVSNIETLNN
jgi:hypothetical protein